MSKKRSNKQTDKPVEAKTEEVKIEETKVEESEAEDTVSDAETENLKEDTVSDAETENLKEDTVLDAETENLTENTDNLSNDTDTLYGDTDTLYGDTDTLYGDTDMLRSSTDNLYANTDNLTGDGHREEAKKKNKLLDNLGLKILALLCSFVIWFVVMNLEDGVITKTIYDIPVNIINGDTITQNGKLYNVTEGETVDVIVKGPRSTVENLEATSFEATADISHLSVTNSTTINVALNNTVSVSRAKKVSITPVNQYVILSIEEEIEKSIPVRVITTGNASDGYAIGNVVPTPNMITVSGPESVLSNIVEARAVVDVNGAYEDIERVVRVGCIDGYGAAVEKDNVFLSANDVTVSIPVYGTKEVPINITTAGKVHDGYDIRSINFEPSTVVIAGEKEVLDTIESIDIKDVVVTDATSNIEKNIDIVEYLPGDVFVADSVGNEIAVSVEVAETVELEKTLNTGDIRILGATEDKNYEIVDPQPLKIKIQGFEDEIADIEAVDLNPRINLEGYQAGKYDLEIEFDTGDNYTINGTYRVKIEVKDNTP